MVFRPPLALVVLIFLLLPVIRPTANAQSIPERSATVLEIPSLSALAASELHLYALSSTEGLVVFRIYKDSLHYLYRADGMQRRGNQLFVDSRFAYLVKDNTLSVIEPTSMLGVFSSTSLSGKVRRVLRSGTSLFAAVQGAGLLRLSLESAEKFDQPPVAALQLSPKTEVLDLLKQNDQFVILTSEPSILWMSAVKDSLTLTRKYALDRALDGLIVQDQHLSGYDGTGSLYGITSTGKTTPKTSFKEPVERVSYWRASAVVRTRSSALWLIQPDGMPVSFKAGGPGGNFAAVSKGRLWVGENNTVAEYRMPAGKKESETTGITSGERVKLNPIAPAVVSYPRPFIGIVTLAEGNLQDVRLFTRSGTVQELLLKGQGMYWQPASRDIGRHYVTVYAAHKNGLVDSVQFSIDVRPFNAPPRFTPVLPQTVMVGETFELPLKATDPDGLDPDFVRYVGLNLPDGSQLDEQTGRFTWKPAARQSGQQRFRVMATDQFGASAAIEVQINVLQAQ